MILGIGQENVRKIDTDARFRMMPSALVQAIRGDIADGWRPFCVVATVGTTSTTSIDPVEEIAPICRDFGLWLHVDGAYGAWPQSFPRCAMFSTAVRAPTRLSSIRTSGYSYQVSESLNS